MNAFVVKRKVCNVVSVDRISRPLSIGELSVHSQLNERMVSAGFNPLTEQASKHLGRPSRAFRFQEVNVG